MDSPRAPSGLKVKGERLWRELHALHELDPVQTVLLEEACRIADRLDRLDLLVGGRATAWARLLPTDDDRVMELTIDGAVAEARQQATVLKQLLAALRLPDVASGARPQQRGGARGSYTPSGAAGRRGLKIV